MKYKNLILIVFIIITNIINAQDVEIEKKLISFDKEMKTHVKNWNIPGVGIGIVKNGKLVCFKGYGYRDYESKKPITENTLFQIASNTKLFTAIAAGFLVEEGKLDWDKPIREYVSQINFYNNELNNNVTLRDMLSHRTGVSRHDLIWYKSNRTRSELFEKIRYLEPVHPLRKVFLYNNLMYAAVGHVVYLIEGKKWEEYVAEKILNPLKMENTVFSINEMLKSNDYFVPYNEKRDTTVLYKIDYNKQTEGMGPAGSIISNISDLSHWLAALMNEGRYEGIQIIPKNIINATLEPSIPDFNYYLNLGYTEVLNPIYGMGREVISYRGHQLVLHGGDLNGIHSQISYMPQDSLGVIVFVIGDHSLQYNSIVFNIYEHLLGMSITPWSERELSSRDSKKVQGKEARQKVNENRIKGTKPTHPLKDYLGEFENKMYGIINIEKIDTQMFFNINNIHLPMCHFHYNRFDTENNEEDGFFSINYQINPQGEIDKFVVSLDEKEVVFVKKTDASLSSEAILSRYIGRYVTGSDVMNIVIKNKSNLYLSNRIDYQLIPYKPNVFKIKEFADYTIEFVMEGNNVVAMKLRDGTGEYKFNKE